MIGGNHCQTSLKSFLICMKNGKRGLGQGNMAYPGTEVSRRKKIGDFTYLIHICGDGSYMQNLDHADKRKRMICFLPEHRGSTIGEKVQAN